MIRAQCKNFCSLAFNSEWAYVRFHVTALKHGQPGKESIRPQPSSSGYFHPVDACLHGGSKTRTCYVTGAYILCVYSLYSVVNVQFNGN